MLKKYRRITESSALERVLAAIQKVLHHKDPRNPQIDAREALTEKKGGGRKVAKAKKGAKKKAK